MFRHTENVYAFHTRVTSVNDGDGVMEHRAGFTILDADLAGFTGEARVIGGALMVNSTLGADVTVENGGTLGGSGAILGDVVALAGATVLPGNSPGVLTINGDFTLDPGALLQNGNHRPCRRHAA